MDFNGSFLARVRDLAGANPIILVVTKVMICRSGSRFFYRSVLGVWSSLDF